VGISLKPYYQEGGITIYCGDCREILPELPKVDLVLTDPPYPDCHPEFGDCDISFLNTFDCRQLVFWSAKVDFPLDYTAIHIWHKYIGFGCEYERLFERNGKARFQVFKAHVITNKVTALRSNDIFTKHPTQKPQYLISRLIEYACPHNGIILDPFLGSGTTAYCAKKLNHKCIGIEISEEYCAIAKKRLSQSVMKLEA